MTIGSVVCHQPSGALFRLSGRVGDWYCGYDTAGAWGQWPASECAASDEPVGAEAGGWYGEPRQRGEREGW
jgi:hypothetical protein